MLASQAGGVALRKLLVREGVIHIVGVALTAEFLIDQGLNAGHGGRAERGAAAALHDGVIATVQERRLGAVSDMHSK